MFHLIQSDALRIPLADESVQCVVTSPPYWGLRDYGTARWEGGSEGCDHKMPGANKVFGNPVFNENRPSRALTDTVGYRDLCGKCGAIRIDSQLGLEKTPGEYVEKMVAVFREVKRVLRPDGVCFVNLGDSYAAGSQGQGSFGDPSSGLNNGRSGVGNKTGEKMTVRQRKPPDGLKPKDLVGIPWLVAKALQAPYYIGRIKSELDRAWLAAIIDGEGCMFIHKRKAGSSAYSYFQKRDGTEKEYFRNADTFGVGLEVSNTHREIVDRCMEITGIGSICEQSPAQNHRRKQRIYRWNVRTNECKWIIRELYPYFVGKKHEARLVLGCPSSGKDAEEAHKSLMALHNGNAPTIDFDEPKSLYEPGWYLRSDIIWAKKNCMPESCQDRPTKSHEYIFLLTKNASTPIYWFNPRTRKGLRTKPKPHYRRVWRNGKIHWVNWWRSRDYFWDQEAVKEPAIQPLGTAKLTGQHKADADGFTTNGHSNSTLGTNQGAPGRNLRTVWTIATQAWSEAHFATYPEELAERCIKAGTSEKGACAKCGAPYQRVMEKTGEYQAHWAPGKQYKQMALNENRTNSGGVMQTGFVKTYSTINWQPTCSCNAPTRPCIVLDPFAGAGTTCLVADRLGRRGIGLDIKWDYLQMATRRCYDDAPLLAHMERE